MMKLLSGAVILAVAAARLSGDELSEDLLDLEPPVISLSLAQSSLQSGPTDSNGIPCVSHMANKASCANLATKTVQTHYAFCEVSEDGPESCPEPMATAHDHHDGEIEVMVTRKLFVKSPPHGVATIANTPVSSVDYSQRGEYTLVYEAQDRAGNKADAMIFHMFVRDTKPPAMSAGTSAGAFSTHFKLPTVHAIDKYDGNCDDTVSITVDGAPYNAAAGVDVTHAGTKIIAAEAHDFAGVFGSQMKNNDAQLTGTLSSTGSAVTVTWGTSTTVYNKQPQPTPVPAPHAPAPMPVSHTLRAPPVLQLFDGGHMIQRGSAWGQAGTKEKYVKKLRTDGHSEDAISGVVQDIVAREMRIAMQHGEEHVWHDMG
jgi:hypothetical protein